MLTPIGEFTFIIAQVGVLSGFCSLRTTTRYQLVSRYLLLCGHPFSFEISGNLAHRLVGLEPKLWRDPLDEYQDFLAFLLESHRRFRYSP